MTLRQRSCVRPRRQRRLPPRSVSPMRRPRRALRPPLPRSRHRLRPRCRMQRQANASPRWRRRAARPHPASIWLACQPVPLPVHRNLSPETFPRQRTFSILRKAERPRRLRRRLPRPCLLRRRRDRSFLPRPRRRSVPLLPPLRPPLRFPRRSRSSESRSPKFSQTLAVPRHRQSRFRAPSTCAESNLRGPRPSPIPPNSPQPRRQRRRRRPRPESPRRPATRAASGCSSASVVIPRQSTTTGVNGVGAAPRFSRGNRRTLPKWGGPIAFSPVHSKVRRQPGRSWTMRKKKDLRALSCGPVQPGKSSMHWATDPRPHDRRACLFPHGVNRVIELCSGLNHGRIVRDPHRTAFRHRSRGDDRLL